MTISLISAVATAAINAACNAIVDSVDQGAAAGYMELQTAGSVEVATLTFGDPAFGAAAAGVATANAITPDSSATGNASGVTIFRVFDSDDVELWNGSVAESGADLNMDDGTPGGGVIINAAAVVSISSLTFTVSLA